MIIGNVRGHLDQPPFLGLLKWGKKIAIETFHPYSFKHLPLNFFFNFDDFLNTSVVGRIRDMLVVFSMVYHTVSINLENTCFPLNGCPSHYLLVQECQYN